MLCLLCEQSLNPACPCHTEVEVKERKKQKPKMDDIFVMPSKRGPRPLKPLK